jgi:hypothetical protein
LASRARLAEFGNRTRTNETDAFLSTLGLKGDRLFDGNWGWDAAFRYSQITNTSRETAVSASRVNRILNANDPIFDPGSSEFIGTTVPYNPFGDFRVPIANNAIPTEFATIHPTSVDRSKLATLDLNIYTTSLFKLLAEWGSLLAANFNGKIYSKDPMKTGPGNFTDAGRKSYALYGRFVYASLTKKS